MSRQLMQRFCVLTTGRSGSTALMKALDLHKHISLPDQSISCDDYELLHPNKCQTYVRYFEQLAKHPINTPAQLVDAFYAANTQLEFAGFKSMPGRDRTFRALGQRTDITFITLVRRDIPSTIASFMLAMEKGTWRRAGGQSLHRWRFTPAKQQQVLSNLAYLKQSFRMLESVPNAIRLYYEDLCQPDYSSPQLEIYFGHPITFERHVPPTSAATYVENWPEFKRFVLTAWQESAAVMAVHA